MENQGAAILGLKAKSIGKTQARQNFFPLVDTLGQTASAVEITDHNKPVAVLLSYTHWLALTSKLAMLSKKPLVEKPVNLIGSIQIAGDLETASNRLAQKFNQSVKESAEKL